MEKNKFRAVIKHLHMKSLTVKEIKAELDNVHSTSAPAFATVYNWVNEACGIIHIDYLYEANDYYALFDRSNNILKKKRPHLAKKKVLFSHVSGTKFNKFRYELLPYPAYSPDLASCDYFLFSNLKKWFGGKRFTIKEQLTAETDAYFEWLDKSYYSDGLKKLENRWIKYIELKGDYVEK
ncbi:SETMR methyltransferase, partial [Acromyrmex charruanus]